MTRRQRSPEIQYLVDAPKHRRVLDNNFEFGRLSNQQRQRPPISTPTRNKRVRFSDTEEFAPITATLKRDQSHPYEVQYATDNDEDDGAPWTYDGDMEENPYEEKYDDHKDFPTPPTTSSPLPSVMNYEVDDDRPLQDHVRVQESPGTMHESPDLPRTPELRQNGHYVPPSFYGYQQSAFKENKTPEAINQYYQYQNAPKQNQLESAFGRPLRNAQLGPEYKPDQINHTDSEQSYYGPTTVLNSSAAPQNPLVQPAHPFTPSLLQYPSLGGRRSRAARQGAFRPASQYPPALPGDPGYRGRYGSAAAAVTGRASAPSGRGRGRVLPVGQRVTANGNIVVDASVTVPPGVPIPDNLPLPSINKSGRGKKTKDS